MDRYQIEAAISQASRDELQKMFGESWFNEIVPDARLMVGCGQGSKLHLEGDVAVHTGLVFDAIRSVSRQRLGREPTFIELLSAVLHDCRKPATRRDTGDGGVEFPGHERLAAEEVPAIGARLGLAPEEIEQLYFLVAFHGDVHGWPQLSEDERSSLKSSQWITSLALLQEADAKSCRLLDGGHLPVYWEQMTAT
jgi:hypothetical protein